MTRTEMTQGRPLTLAEICQAIESGHLVADIQDNYYTVRLRDLVRLARRQAARDKTAQPRPVTLAG